MGDNDLLLGSGVHGLRALLVGDGVTPDVGDLGLLLEFLLCPLSIALKGNLLEFEVLKVIDVIGFRDECFGTLRVRLRASTCRSVRSASAFMLGAAPLPLLWRRRCAFARRSPNFAIGASSEA